jgi:thioredoxin 1
MTQRRGVAAHLSRGVVITLLVTLALAGCGAGAGGPEPTHSAGSTAQVTFVELGSDSCIPCKEMRPVMAAITGTFGDQVEVVFHDVTQDAAAAQEYDIQYIPTQVFLDENGVEFHRHTGFYPAEDIEALLVEYGLTKVATP